MKLFTYIRNLFFAPKPPKTPVIFSSSYCPGYNVVGTTVLPTVEELAGVDICLGDTGFVFTYEGETYEVGENEIFVHNVFVGTSFPYHDMVADLYDLRLQEIVDLQNSEAAIQRNF